MQLHSCRRLAVARCRRVVALLLSIGAVLLVFFRLPPGGLVAFNPMQIGVSTPGMVVPPRRVPLAVRGIMTTAAAATSASGDADQAVLLPAWEVLVLLRDGGPMGNATCAFGDGASLSPARSLGRLRGSGREAYVCVMPRQARRRQPFTAPRVVDSASLSAVPVPAAGGAGGGSVPAGRRAPEMLRWSGRLVYDSAVVDGGDVLVFAKGVNPRQGVNREVADVRCVYYRGGTDDDVVASLPAATSAQQVFRCPPPPSTTPVQQPSSSQELRVTLAVTGEEPIPSLAVYSPSSSSPTPGKKMKKKLICACTMVRDVGKFLREWVVYHAAVGVERFYLYDNGSEDDLAEQVRRLSSAGYDVAVVAWPWTKSQEAGFSHAAAAHRASCEWMAFVDVDEFIFSPTWTKSKKPTGSMLRSVVSAVEPDVGQVSLGCADFGPSGRTMHPSEGVTQGYTCRRRTKERHKSLVRLDAVDRSLVNSVHHFALQARFRGERSKLVRVNHYKYQAWEEFKVKFRRRVSTYVADWTDPVNLRSRDRTPGLGFEAVEPVGWTYKFCEVYDPLLRDATRQWFGDGFLHQYGHRQRGKHRSSSRSKLS